MKQPNHHSAGPRHTASIGIAAFAAFAVALRVAAMPASGTPARTLAVYFVRGEHVSPVGLAEPSTGGLASAALRRLLAGPSAAERRAGYTTAVPSGTALRRVDVHNDLLTVDLRRRFASGGGSLSMQLRVAQIVYTATQFPSVKRVAFRLEGRPVTAVGGEGVLVRPPPSRVDFEQLAPAILVEQPLRSARLRSPFTIRGTANVFEASFVVELRSPQGRVVSRHNVNATAGTGTRGVFSTTLTTARTGWMNLVVFSRSPKDGRPINLIRIPIRLTG